LKNELKKELLKYFLALRVEYLAEFDVALRVLEKLKECVLYQLNQL